MLLGAFSGMQKYACPWVLTELGLVWDGMGWLWFTGRGHSMSVVVQMEECVCISMLCVCACVNSGLDVWMVMWMVHLKKDEVR